MEFLCPPSAVDSGFDNFTTEDAGNETYNVFKDNVTSNVTARYYAGDPGWDYRDFVMKVAVPVLCSFGIFGNILNIVILSTKIRDGVDSMEKGALVGMMALAASDFLFCVVTISGIFLPEKFMWHERDFSYFHTLYGNFLQNTLIKMSTWFTVILAVSRYVVVSNPIRARQYMRCIHTVVAILTCTVIWILLHIPLIYMWKVIVIHCPVPTVYFLISGKFARDKALNSTFTYIWGILGFILPFLILAYCNFKLIHSLRLSTKLRIQSQKGQKKSTDSNNQKLITVTLVSIVCMFFVLVLPSEIVFFYGEIAMSKFSDTYRMVHVTFNLLQAINFSMNFVLYCCVNQYFRKVVRFWLSRVPLVKKLIHKKHLAPYHFRLTKTTSRSPRSSVISKQTMI